MQSILLMITTKFYCNLKNYNLNKNNNLNMNYKLQLNKDTQKMTQQEI